MFFLTEDLLTSVKKRSLVPMSDKTFADADLIRFANEEMQTFLVPDVLKQREDFFLRTKDVTIVSGVNHYQVPERAIGNGIKDLWFINANASVTRALPRLEARDSTLTASTSNEPVGYYFRGDEIVLVPTPASAVGTLRFLYFARPSKLVSTNTCSKVTAVSSSGGATTFTVDTDLSGSFSVGSIIDIVNAQSPFVLLGENISITGITTSTISVATSDVSDESGNVIAGLGDYFCTPQCSNVPMIPQELHPVLSAMVTKRCLAALGDTQKLQAHMVELAEMRKQAFTLLTNRAESGTRGIVSRNGIFNYIGGFGVKLPLP